MNLNLMDFVHAFLDKAIFITFIIISKCIHPNSFLIYLKYLKNVTFILVILITFLINILIRVKILRILF